ncbi:MAG: erythromycin esterase family protein [Bacteroidota bacterium]
MSYAPTSITRTLLIGVSLTLAVMQAMAQVPTTVPEATDREAAIDAWVRAHAVPLGTVEPDADRRDLQPLLDPLSKARVVAVGESTHGTRDFFQFKDRLWRFLVEEAGFRALAMEAGFAEAQAIDAYVTRGEGTAEEALEGLGIGVWNTEEVLALIEWTRAYNDTVPVSERVRFYGIDPRSARLELERLGALLHDVTDPQALALLAQADSLRAILGFEYRHAEGPTRAALDDALRDLGSLIDRAPPDALTLSEGETARQHLTALGQIRDLSRERALGQPELLGSGYYHLRDRIVPKADSLRQFLYTYDPTLPGRLDRFLNAFLDAHDQLNTATRASFDLAYPDQHWDALAHALHAHTYLMQNQHRMRGATTADVERARLWASDIALYTQTARAYTLLPSPRPNPRDAAMAENVRWVLDTEGPDARVMVWGHNWHITTKPMAPGAGRMGTHLAETLGDDYVAVGFAFDRGQFTAGDRRPQAEPMTTAVMTVGPAKDGSIDATLARADLPLFYLDLGAVPEDGPVRAWLSEPRPLRDVPASFLPSNEINYYVDTVLLDDYDAVVFVGETQAARRR